MSKPHVLVVGSANIDLVTRVPRCPKPGESIIGLSFSTICGGKGANQAVAAARLGAETYFAACVGDDAFGALQRETLGREGIDLSHLKSHPSEPTGTAVILVAEEGQNSIIVTPSANYGITPGDIEAMTPLIDRMDAITIQLEIPLETVEATLRKARELEVLTILDAGPAQKVPQSIVELAGIVSPNETEAEAMTKVRVNSIDDAREAANRLMHLGAREVVLKLGKMGALYMSANEWFHVPAFEVKPVDTVAAGDAFTAALGVAWLDSSPLEAIRFANAVGALATLKEAAQPSMHTREEVDQFMYERGT